MSQPLGFVVSADTSSLLAKMVEAGQITQTQAGKMQRALQFVSRELQSMAQAQKAATDITGAAAAQGNAAVLAQNAIAQAQRTARAEANQLKQAYRQLPAQITDVVTSLASGMPVWMVAIQQGGQIKDSFGGIAPTFKALGAIINPTTVALGAIGIAAGAVAFEMYAGAQASDALRKSLVLTGNFAGVTEGQLRALAAAQAAQTKTTEIMAREAYAAVVASGQFGPSLITPVADAILRYQKLTGETADKALKVFDSLSSGAAKWAQEQSRTFHFLDVATFEQIDALERHGKTQEAQRVAVEAFDNALKSRHLPALGYVANAWQFWTDKIGEARAALRDFGSGPTLEDQFAASVERLRLAYLALAAAKRNSAAGLVSDRPQDRAREVEAAQAAYDQIAARMGLQKAAVDAQAEIARRQQEGVGAVSIIDQTLRETKAQQGLNAEMARYRDLFDKAAAAGKAYSAADQAAVYESIRRKFRAPGQDFVEQLQRQVQTQKHGPFDMLRLEASQKGVSAAAAVYISELERMDLVARSIKRTVEETAKEEEQRARIASLVNTGNDVARGLADQTETLGMTAQAQRRLTELRRVDVAVQQLMQGANGETRAELELVAASMRRGVIAALDELEAKEQAMRDHADWGQAIGEYVKTSADATKQAEQLVSGAFQRMEDAIINFARTGRLSFRDLFSFMAEEYLRNMIRMAEKNLLMDGAGGFIGFGAMLKGIGSFASSLFSAVSVPLAGGMDYVPYDGFPATLHRGERVQTAVEAASTRGGGTVVVNAPFNGDVGAGVSKAEMASALALHRSVILNSFRRMQQQGLAA